MIEPGFEKLPRNKQIYMLDKWEIPKTEIGAMFNLSRSRVYQIVEDKNMKLCDEEAQEKCDNYEETESRPGYVDLTCLYYRTDILEDPVCTAPPKKVIKK